MGKALLQPPVPIGTLLDKQGNNRAPEIMELVELLYSLLSGHLTDQHMQDGGVDARVLKLASVTRNLLAADVDRMAVGRYTGDGVAGRTINVADSQGQFTPTEVDVLAITDNNEFKSRDDGTAVVSWWRTAAGAVASGLTDWQGIVANGFKTGSNVESLTNKTGQAYTWVAWKRG